MANRELFHTARLHARSVRFTVLTDFKRTGQCGIRQRCAATTSSHSAAFRPPHRNPPQPYPSPPPAAPVNGGALKTTSSLGKLIL